MILYELCGANRDIRFSPYTWRIKMALAHKGIAYEGVPCRFLEKDAFAASGSKTVPVIEDDGTWVADSWAIAEYLEQTYPDKPTLFGGAIGRGQARFINDWADRSILIPLFFAIITDIPKVLGDDDRAYFLESRAARLGRPVEDFGPERDQHLQTLHKALSPLKSALTKQPFICGDAPAYADYILFGGFQWARLVSPIDVLAGMEPLVNWRERMLGLYGGLGANAQSAV